jgi:eukaryotic-like serine/threonine-protein kinase
VMGKFVDGAPDSEARAEEAFRRALALNPRLSIAHKFYANLEADTGHADRAMVRLLSEATRHGNDPELFAGLVHACRYCGLFEESVAAHAEARRLDPNVPTGVEQSLMLACEFDRLFAIPLPSIDAGADNGIRVIALGLAGRVDEARERLLAMGQLSTLPAFQLWFHHLMAWLDRRREELFKGMSFLGPLKVQEDPEAIFQMGWLLCDAGEHEAGLDYLQRAVAKGYYVAPTLSRGRQFDRLRDLPAFQALLAEAEAGRGRALEAFREAGGERLLGV